jgi:hypothetical protein
MLALKIPYNFINFNHFEDIKKELCNINLNDTFKI